MERTKDFLTKNTLSAIKLAGFLHCFPLKERFLEVRCFLLKIWCFSLERNVMFFI